MGLCSRKVFAWFHQVAVLFLCVWDHLVKREPVIRFVETSLKSVLDMQRIRISHP